MQVNPINNQSFEAKKFRLIATAINYDRVGSTYNNYRKCGKYIQEYSNPKAKNLYEQAQKNRDVKEQIRLYNEMGHYELKCLNLFEIIREKLNKFVMNKLL